jgi:hypothetical protein
MGFSLVLLGLLLDVDIGSITLIGNRRYRRPLQNYSPALSFRRRVPSLSEAGEVHRERFENYSLLQGPPHKIHPTALASQRVVL